MTEEDRKEVQRMIAEALTAFNTSAAESIRQRFPEWRREVDTRYGK